jgi:hypothetical protein
MFLREASVAFLMASDTSLALPNPQPTLPFGVTRDDEGAEAEAAAAFDDLGATIDVNDFFNAIHFARTTIITTTEARH